MDFEIGQGDTQPPYCDRLRNPNKTPFDLSLASNVKLKMWRADGGDRPVLVAATVVDARAGAVQVNLPVTTCEGVYLAQWVVAFPSAGQQTFPRGDYRRISVTPSRKT